jgi:hypothetical protein
LYGDLFQGIRHASILIKLEMSRIKYLFHTVKKKI